MLGDHLSSIQLGADAARSPVILQVCLSRSWGGLEMYPAKVSREMVAHGYEVHALALAHSKVSESFTDERVPVLAFGSQLNALLSLRQIVSYIDRHKINVIHAHKSGDMRVAALLVKFAPNVKLFFTDHIGVGRPKKGFYHRWAYSKVERVFSISEFTHARNIKAFALEPDRIAQLYNGIAFSDYEVDLDIQGRGAVRDSLGVPKDAVLIAMPGRLTPGKGQMLWLEALSRLKQMNVSRQWHGVVIGEASPKDSAARGYRDQLTHAVDELGLAGRVTFAGFRADMARCLQASDITAIPSFAEAFGLAVVEAMAASCTVVGARAGALPELITPDTGLLVDVDAPEQWALCFRQLIDDAALRHRLGAHAKAHVLSRFGMATHVQRLIAFYEQSRLC